MAKSKLSIIIASTVAAILANPLKMAMEGDLERGLTRLAASFTGYDIQQAQFSPGTLKHGLAPLIMGAISKALATRLNVGRYMRGLPVGP